MDRRWTLGGPSVDRRWTVATGGQGPGKGDNWLAGSREGGQLADRAQGRRTDFFVLDAAGRICLSAVLAMCSASGGSPLAPALFPPQTELRPRSSMKLNEGE